MFSLVFSFQWNTDLNSFMMQAYVSEKVNNFHPPLPPPQKKKKPKKLGLSKTLLVGACSATRSFDVR